MKTIKQAILILTVFLATLSCEKETVIVQQSNAEKIIGNWILLESILDGQQEYLDSCTLTSTLRITQEKFIFTWNYNSPETGCESYSIDSYDYTINDYTVTMYEEGSFSYEIKELTDNNLKIERDGGLLHYEKI